MKDAEEQEKGASTVGEYDSVSDEDTADDDIDDSAIQTNIIMEADIEGTEDGVANMNIDSSDMMKVDVDTTTLASTETKILADQESEPLFVVDTVGDESLAFQPRVKAKAKQPVRPLSPEQSDSNEEVITFRGRNKPTVIDDPFSAPTPKPKQKPQPAAHQPRASPHPTDDLLNALTAPSASSKPSSAPSTTAATSNTARSKTGWAGATSIHDLSVRPADEWTPAPAVPYWKKQNKGMGRPDLAPSQVWEYEKMPSRPSKVQFVKQASSNRSSKNSRKKDNRALRNAALTDDEDSGGEAAYDDYMQNLMAQMDDQTGDPSEEALLANLKATAVLSQPSMVIHGKPVDDSEVLPKHMRENGTDESGVSEGWETDSNNSDEDEDEDDEDEDLSSSELEEDLEYNEREMWEDEEDLRQRRYDKMTDEQIARLLAKQQELGIEGDELMIDDGMYVEESDDGFGDLAAARKGLAEVHNFKSGRAKNKHGMRVRGHDKKYNFPDASLLADTVEQYGENGFDIMDFDRPSLRPTKKGRKGKIPPELEALSDEELRDQIRDQWGKDRSKKAQKKLEREELRREGLLGSAGRKGKADLKAKYPFGMNMHNVHDELRDFLQRDDLLERAFPPMDKIDRKALHEICTALNLGSKSQGSGNKRFPIIYKTSRTSEYSNEMFVKIVQASSRGFLSNRGKAKKFANKTSKGTLKGGRGGGFSKAAVGLQNGEIVGAGAAEISHTSFGARMLAKHGWSKGMGLGKDGEGRILPVEQVMRMGTAGLG